MGLSISHPNDSELNHLNYLSISFNLIPTHDSLLIDDAVPEAHIDPQEREETRIPSSSSSIEVIVLNREEGKIVQKPISDRPVIGNQPTPQTKRKGQDGQKRANEQMRVLDTLGQKENIQVLN